MGVPKPPGDTLAQLASGIEAGVIGGMAMMLLLVSGSLLLGHAWVEVPNLLGSTFYGPRAFRQTAGLATLSGAALHFVITGAVGALFGLVCGRVHERRRLILLGLVAGFVWYYLADAVLWSRVNPLVPIYSPQPATLLAHALFGACLGSMGRHAARYPSPVQVESPPGPPPVPDGTAEPFKDALE
ncbi:MAG TPA: hypothetical protein VGN17_17355 [Bryobacteraceae bacterium]|jgi:hypothetical protein